MAVWIAQNHLNCIKRKSLFARIDNIVKDLAAKYYRAEEASETQQMVVENDEIQNRDSASLKKIVNLPIYNFLRIRSSKHL